LKTALRLLLPLSEVRFEYFGVNLGKSLKLAVLYSFRWQILEKLFLHLYSALRSPPEVQFIDVKHEINFRAACAPTERTGCAFARRNRSLEKEGKAAWCTVKHKYV